MTEAKRKHVIFLGAGASKSSGYPDAARLRIILGDDKAFMEHMRSHEDKDVINPARARLSETRRQFKDTLDNFRYGCFASVDEFCKLAGPHLSQQVQQLKRMVRIVLGVVDPERFYTESDYYPFIQKLFKPDLPEFRDDIVILTYNYDVYLPYLLVRSAYQRVLAHAKKPLDLQWRNDLSGGLACSGDPGFVSRERFSLLALHGLICYPMAPPRVMSGGAELTLTPEDFLPPNSPARLDRINETWQEAPPMIFPWEFLNDDGKLKSDFSGWDHPADVVPPKNLSACFLDIWQRARSAVQAADKVSFVGIAMHNYLLGGLKYLFDGKAGVCDVVSVSPENPALAQEESETYRRSPAGKLLSFLTETCPDLGSPLAGRDDETCFRPDLAEPLEVRSHDYFAEFIRNEL